MPSIDIDSGPLDSKADAEDWLVRYENAYPVWGYSTRLVITHTNGQWRVTGSRWSSSD